MKKLLLSLSLVLILALTACNCSSSSTGNESKRITLTKQNFEDYFTYEVTGRAYSTDKTLIWYNGEIIVTFYPLKNIEVENCSISIAVKDTPSNGKINVYQYVNGEVEDKVTREVRVPYDGKFSVTFNDIVEFSSRTGSASNSKIKVEFEAVSGTIIEK